MLALPIFPASRPASIVGGVVLNFCVRDGNRWTHDPINTNFFEDAPSKPNIAPFFAITSDTSLHFADQALG